MGANLSRLKKGISILGGRFKLLVSPDGLKAYLVPQLPGDFPASEDLEELKSILKKEGIIYGILDAPEPEGTVWVVARGQPAEAGRDAKLKFFVNLKRGPRQKGELLDYREMNTLVCVSQGQIIAKKYPPTPGKPGQDVFGNEIPAPSGNDFSIKVGSFVSFDENSGLIKAQKAGVIHFEKNKFEIFPEFILKGDVNWDVGNIHFKGQKLIITGGVKRGFKLRIEGDLEIQGSIEDGVEIEVIGQLTVKGLIHGKNLKIRCQSKAFLNEVEYAYVEVNQDLEVSEYLLQAKGIVGGNLIVTKGVGAIIGGEYFVKGTIITRVLGSGGQVKTIVHAGFDPKQMANLEEIEEKLLLIQEGKRPLIIALKKGLELLKSGNLSTRKLLALEKTKEKLINLIDEERILKVKRQKILSYLQKAEKNKVIILNRVLAGVEIRIGRKHFIVTDRGQAGVFLVRGQQIIFEPAQNFTS